MNSVIARRQGILVRAVIVILALASVAITTSRSPVRASVRGEIPADGETWIKVDSGRHVLVPSEDMMSLTRFQIDSILCKWEPENAPAVYCNPADRKVFTPDSVRRMVGTK